MNDAELIVALLEVPEEKLNEWEMDFVESVVEWADTHDLTGAQELKCEQIIEEKGS